MSLLSKNSVRVVSNLTRQEIETALRTFGKGDAGAEALAVAFRCACADIDPSAIYAKWEKEIERVLAEKDYPAALSYYKTKGLAAEANAVFSVKFEDQVMRWLRSKSADPLVAALRAAIPIVPAPTLMSLNESIVEDAALTGSESWAMPSGTGRISRPVNRRRSGIRLATWCWWGACARRSGG